MNRKEYLEQLQKELSCFPADFAADILNDYEEHFKLGKENGKSEEQICRELGSISEFIRELKEAEPDLAAAGLQVSVPPSPAHSSGQESGDGYRCAAVSASFAKADILVRRSPDHLVHAYYKNRGSLDNKLNFRFLCRQQGDTLYLSMEDNPQSRRGLAGFVSFLVSSPQYNVSVLVELPEHFPQALFQTKSGDIRMEAVSAGAVSAETISGDVTLSSCQLRSLSMSTKSGDFQIQDSQLDAVTSRLISGDLSLSRNQIGEILMTSISGDLAGTDNQIQKAKFKSTSGDLELSGRFLEAEMQVISGDISLEQDAAFPSSLKCSSISGDTSCRVRNCTGLSADVTSSTGDVSVRCMGQSFRNSAPLRQTISQKFGDGSTVISATSVSGDVRISEC